MLSRFFIARPVLANVLAILTVLAGAYAVFTLPVAQYPNVVPPTVQVTTRYPGASPTDVMRSVALPIEQQVNGVQNMLYMQSTSTADGTYTLTVTFAIGTDLDGAQVLVQNRVQTVLASLPSAVQAQGVTVQKRSTAILQIIALTSSDPRHDSLYLSNYAILNMRDVLARVPGVGNINVFGAGQYAMRVWLDPERLRARGLTLQDVTQNLQQQNMDVTAGQFGSAPAPAGQARQYTLVVAGRLAEASAFEDIILKAGAGGAITRLRDVGRVELGAQSYGQVFTLDGQPAAGLAIFQSPDANALAVATGVQTTLDGLRQRFPPGVAASVPFDSTVFVRASIWEVYKTLIETASLVLAVILLFLQDWRAMLVPATTVPVTIIGAFAAMAIFGFSINLSTLFAIVLADRHRRGRRDRRGRAGGPSTSPAGGRPGHGRGTGARRIIRPDHRHHAGADGRVHPGLVPAGPVGPALCAVRAGDRRHRGHQRGERRHVESRAMRHLAAPAAPGPSARIGLPAVRPRPWRRRAPLCPRRPAPWPGMRGSPRRPPSC